MLQIHDFSSHATVHTTTTQYIPTGGMKMKNEKEQCRGVSKIGTSHLTDIPVFKRPSNQWRKQYPVIRYPPIALQKVDQVFKYYITSLQGVATVCIRIPLVVLPCTGSSHPPTHWLPNLIFFHALFTSWTAAFLFLASFQTMAKKNTHTMKIERRVFIN